MLVALAIVIKPYAVLFLPWLLARRRVPSHPGRGRRPCGRPPPAGGTLRLGRNVSLHQEWWRTVTETTAPNLSVYDNVSLAAMYFRWVGPGLLSERLAYGTAVVLLGVAALAFFKRRGVPFPEGLEGAMLLTLMPLLSPQGLGLRLPDRHAGDRVSGQLPRPPAASDARRSRSSPSRRSASASSI